MTRTAEQNWNRRIPEMEMAAIEVLKLSKRALTIKEIVSKIIELDLAVIRGKTPESSLYAIILRKEKARKERNEPVIFHRIVEGNSIKYTLNKK